MPNHIIYRSNVEDFFFPLMCGQDKSTDENANKPAGIMVLACPARSRNISILPVLYFISRKQLYLRSLLYQIVLYIMSMCGAFFPLNTSRKHY